MKALTVLLLALPGLALAQTEAIQNTRYQFEYDALGNLTQITNPLGQRSRFVVDPLNRRSQMIDANNGTVVTTYDGQDQLTQVSDPRQLMTRYTVDGLGNQIAQSSPDTGQTKRSFDVAGNLQTSTDAKGQTTTYQYDALNRLTQIDFADNSTITYQYDQGANAIGRLTSIRDAIGSIRYDYDRHGRVIRESRSIGARTYDTVYEYDAAGRLTSMTYPSGRVIRYGHDELGRIRHITAHREGIAQPLLMDVEYEPFGAPRRITFGNGRSTQLRNYDLDGRLASYTLNGLLKTLQYDPASRITAIHHAGNPANDTALGYDPVDRLTSYQKPTSSLGWTYDPTGNRTGMVNGAAQTTYHYDATSNRLREIHGGRVATITLDANGSIVNDSTNQFGYDARGRMASVTTPIGIARYRINGLGQRAQKITPTGTTTFHYDLNGKLIGEYDGQRMTETVYLEDMPVAVLR